MHRVVAIIVLTAVLAGGTVSPLSAQELYASDVMLPKEAIPPDYEYDAAKSRACCQGQGLERWYRLGASEIGVISTVHTDATTARTHCESIRDGYLAGYTITPDAGLGAWSLRATKDDREATYFQQGRFCGGIWVNGQQADPAEQIATREMLVHALEALAIERAG